jgi:hypothetical protein
MFWMRSENFEAFLIQLQGIEISVFPLSTK